MNRTLTLQEAPWLKAVMGLDPLCLGWAGPFMPGMYPELLVELSYELAVFLEVTAQTGQDLAS